MSKFRARALDACKPMPIFRADELPDLPDFAAINRAVPQMPSGMEKEEECEHHLQRAMSAQQAYGQTGDLVIPTPEVYECSDSYEFLYPADFKLQRQLIHMQPSAMEQDIPDYDMDSEDDKWVLQQAKKMDVSALQFEEMMDRLEKGSGQQVVTLKEAKSLLKEDDDLIIAVYDYWLNKRLRTQHPLIPQVKTEKRDGSTNNNPYVAFRRRTEKMQTRKNRKNDEASYEKMLKLRRDLSRAVTLIELVKRREKSKREHLHLTVEIFEKRYQTGDFSGQLLAELSAIKNSTKPTYVAVHNNSNQYTINRQPEWTNRLSKAEVGVSRKKREYKKRKHKDSQQTSGHAQSSVRYVDMADGGCGLSVSSEDEVTTGASPSEQEDENDPDGQFSFRRRKNCNYQAPILEGMGNWPWCSAQDGGLADRKFRYCLTSLSLPRPRCLGFARRRIGRGGRILLDRACTPFDDLLSDFDLANHGNPVIPNGMQSSNELLSEIRNEWLHFRPQTPPCALEGTECKDRGESRTACSNNTSSGQFGVGTSCGSGGVANQMEFNVESFHSHQEELVEMQRRQIERLRQDGAAGPSEHSLSSQPTSHFTVDSASAQFAVSAVITTTQVSGILGTLTSPLQSVATNASNHPSTSSHNSIALSNGPTTPYVTSIPPSNKLSGISSMDRMAPPSQSSSLSLVLAIPPTHTSSHTTSCVSSPVNVIASRSGPFRQAAHDLKLSQMGTSNEANVNSEDPVEKNNPKVKVDNLLNENALPMEVT